MNVIALKFSAKEQRADQDWKVGSPCMLARCSGEASSTSMSSHAQATVSSPVLSSTAPSSVNARAVTACATEGPPRIRSVGGLSWRLGWGDGPLTDHFRYTAAEAL